MESETDTDTFRQPPNRIVTTVELMKNPQGPPLDYSFLGQHYVHLFDLELMQTHA